MSRKGNLLYLAYFYYGLQLLTFQLYNDSQLQTLQYAYVLEKPGKSPTINTPAFIWNVQYSPTKALKQNRWSEVSVSMATGFLKINSNHEQTLYEDDDGLNNHWCLHSNSIGVYLFFLLYLISACFDKISSCLAIGSRATKCQQKFVMS